MQNQIHQRCVLNDHNYFKTHKVNTNSTQNDQGSDEEYENKCEFCHVKFVKRVDLLTHIEHKHLDIGSETFNCSNCPSIFTNKGEMIKHMNQTHDESRLPCILKKKSHYRKCFVPGCASTSRKCPNKIFLCVPSVPEKREKWFEAVNREYFDSFSPFVKFFCCEDHFDLKNDAKNWLKYKLLGSRPLLIKNGVVPRIFLNKPAEDSPDYHQGIITEHITPEYPVATSQQSQLNNITNENIDIKLNDLLTTSNSAISVSDLLKMSDKRKLRIKNQQIEMSDDFDWCINEEDYPKGQKQLLQDENGSGLKDENNLDTKIDSENSEILNKKLKEINEKSDLSGGKKSLEPVNGMLQCVDCPSSFSKEEDMLQHVRVWHGTTNRRRPQPSTTTANEDSLKHLENRVNVETKDINLMIDSEVFEKFEYYQSNMKDISNKILNNVSKQRHICTICNKDYAYNHFKAHMKEVHSEVKCICTICGAHFKCERYLRRHTLYRHLNKAKPHQMRNECKCPECPKIFKNSDCLSHHVRNCHGDKVECDLCHSKLKSISYLKSHMRRVHYNDGKKHRCRICCKEFKSPRQVKIHMINLHPEALHPCPNCIRLFCNTVQLKIHLKKCKPNKLHEIKEGDSNDEDLTVD